MPRVYLAFNSEDLIEARLNLYNTLVKSGQQVFPSDISFSGDLGLMRENLKRANISIHVLGTTYGKVVSDGKSIEHLQFDEAMAMLRTDPSFRIFAWFPHAFNDIRDEMQQRFISDIRNNVQQGITFTNTPSAIQLTDDLRMSVKVETPVEYDVKDTDVFLVYNQLDDNEAAEVADMLSDIIPVEKLNIIQDSDTDYAELCMHQISKSKLAVVYFKESAEWALPFTQQIWKKIGGASSHTPILLIGDEDPESNMNKIFKAPKVVSLIVSGTLIPLEIKVHYDKVIESRS